MNTFKFFQRIIYPELIDYYWKGIYGHGWEAYLHGNKIPDCPYVSESYRRYWIQGWAKSSAYYNQKHEQV